RSSSRPPLFLGRDRPADQAITGTGALLAECASDALGAERKIAQTVACSMGKGVGNGRCHWPLRGFACAERLFVRPVDQNILDIGYCGHGQDRIAAPVARGDAVAVEADSLVQGPAGRLDHTALNLVLEPVWVDDLAGIGGGERPRYSDPATLAIDFDFG